MAIFTYLYMEVYQSALSIVIVDNFTHHLYIQGCGLGKILRSPKVPNHKTLAAKHLKLTRYVKKGSFSGRPKLKLGHLWHQSASRAQPWCN